MIRVVGVFDTVGSVGLPEELSLSSEKLKNIFGFPDHLLGTHIERAYHAMAINETRADFVSARLVSHLGHEISRHGIERCKVRANS